MTDDFDDKTDEALRSALHDAAPPARFDHARTQLRVERSIRTRALRRRFIRIGAQAAAGVSLFVGGIWYGRTTSVANIPAVALSPSGYTRVGAAQLPLSIQTAGSGYVASLASLTEMRDKLSPAQRDQARAVALSVLAGAMAELAAAGDGRLPPEVLRTVLSIGVPAGGPDDAVVRIRQ